MPSLPWWNEPLQILSQNKQELFLVPQFATSRVTNAGSRYTYKFLMRKWWGCHKSSGIKCPQDTSHFSLNFCRSNLSILKNKVHSSALASSTKLLCVSAYWLWFFSVFLMVVDLRRCDPRSAIYLYYYWDLCEQAIFSVFIIMCIFSRAAGDCKIKQQTGMA